MGQDTGSQNDISYWQRFVDQFFSQSGVLRIQLLRPADQETKQYEISTPALPRYYHTHFESGVRKIQMSLENAREKEVSPNCHYVESHRASFMHWFNDGSLVGGVCARGCRCTMQVLTSGNVARLGRNSAGSVRCPKQDRFP